MKRQFNHRGTEGRGGRRGWSNDRAIITLAVLLTVAAIVAGVLL